MRLVSEGVHRLPIKASSVAVDDFGIALVARQPLQMLPGFDLEDRHELRSTDQGFVFGAFVLTQRCLVRSLGQPIDSRLNSRGGPQTGDPAHGFRVEAAAQ